MFQEFRKSFQPARRCADANDGKGFLGRWGMVHGFWRAVGGLRYYRRYGRLAGCFSERLAATFFRHSRSSPLQPFSGETGYLRTAIGMPYRYHQITLWTPGEISVVGW